MGHKRYIITTNHDRTEYFINEVLDDNNLKLVEIVPDNAMMVATFRNEAKSICCLHCNQEVPR